MATKRRHELQQGLSKALDDALDQLKSTWEDIGIVEDQQVARMEVVMGHVRELLKAMVDEEEGLKEKLMKNVEQYGEELLKLCKELHRPRHQPPSGLSLLQLEKHIRTTVDKLNLEKHDRMKQVKKMKEEDQHLCDILCTTPYYIPSGAVPSSDQLEELTQHVNDLKIEKEKRFREFKLTKGKIARLLDDLERSPNTSLERDVLLEEENSFLLSSDNMKALQRFHGELEENSKKNFALAAKLRDELHSLWERLQIAQEERQAFVTAYTGFRPTVIDTLQKEIHRCEALKKENLASFIAGTRKELQQWWAKCYYSDEQRRKFTAISNDHYTEDLLLQHEMEVKAVKEYYHQYQDMLEKVARRQQLWSEFLEFERKAADPTRFSNRGCNLLKEEKARKKLVKEIPKVEEDVKEQIKEWEEKHQKSFLVGGVKFTDFISKQWLDYQQNKENEKNQRHMKKTKEMEVEMIYGSKPVTPGKRRFIGTPAKTPTKLRRLNVVEMPPVDVDSTSSTVSSVCSDLKSTVRLNSKMDGTAVTPRTMLMNETKTPKSSSRLYRSNFTHVHSPAVVPRSAGPKTPHRPRGEAVGPRKMLTDKRDEPPTFSQTTVAGHSNPPNTSSPSQDDASTCSSLASIGPYQDFAKGLTQTARPNCRSSVMPDRTPAFF